MKKVLYLTYDGLTDPLGQSQVLPYLRGLSALGYDITIISFEKPGIPQSLLDEVARDCEAHRLRWVPQTYTKKPPVLSTVKDVMRLRKLVASLHRKHRFHIVHCRSYLTSLVGLWAKKKFGLRFVFDMRGFWADERVDGNLWRLDNPLYRTIYKFFKRKEKEFFTKADYTVSLTHNAKAEIAAMFNGSTAPIEVIPCCVDTRHFDYNSLRAEQVLKKKEELSIAAGATVISYIGSVGTWYLPADMFSFFKTWKEEDPSAVLLFITPDDAAELQQLAKASGVAAEAIRIVKGTRAEMPLLTACSTYSIFFIKPVFSKKASSPTKQGEIMAMGIPVICNAAIGDTDQVVVQYDAGVVVDRFATEAYRSVIAKLKQKSFDAAAIRKGAEEFFSLEKGIEKYHRIYQAVLAKE